MLLALLVFVLGAGAVIGGYAAFTMRRRRWPGGGWTSGCRRLVVAVRRSPDDDDSIVKHARREVRCRRSTAWSPGSSMARRSRS